MGNPKNTRKTIEIVIVALIGLAIGIFAAIQINGLERTEAPQPKPKGEAAALDPHIVVDPTTPNPASTIHGKASLSQDCAVELVFNNNTAGDLVITIYVETGAGTDDTHEDVIPAGVTLTLTIVRDSPITFVSAWESSGNSGHFVDYSPDYSECANGPATTPPTGGVGDSQQLERPAPETPPTATIDPPIAVI